MGSDAPQSPIAAEESKLALNGSELLETHDKRDFASEIVSAQTNNRNLRSSQSRRSSTVTIDGRSAAYEGERPPLPPRPKNLGLLGQTGKGGTLQLQKRSTRPQLQSYATTAVSRTEIETLSFPDGSRETYASSTKSTPSGKSFRFDSSIRHSRSQANTSEGDDSVSLKSSVPTTGGEVESLLGDIIGAGQQSPAWRLLSSQAERPNPFDLLPYDDEEPKADFSREFDELDDLDASGDNEGKIRMLLL